MITKYFYQKKKYLSLITNNIFRLNYNFFFKIFIIKYVNLSD